MIDSDITGHITSDCEKRMQTPETPGAHGVDCTCDTCCPISESNCQDNRDQCEQTQPSSGRMKKMKDKLVPILANCAVILAVIGLSGSISRINAINRIQAANINAIHRQTSSGVEINYLNIVDLDPWIIDETNARNIGRGRIEGIDLIEISSNRFRD
jgi:hypothetical protein